MGSGRPVGDGIIGRPSVEAWGRGEIKKLIRYAYQYRCKLCVGIGPGVL
jgi:hypothetical protein